MSTIPMDGVLGTILWIAVTLLMFAGLIAMATGAAERWCKTLWRAAVEQWIAIGAEPRWRAIMLTAVAAAVFGAYYRSDDWETQQTFLYDTLIRQRQLVIGAGAVAAIAAYFWLGSLRSVRRDR